MAQYLHPLAGPFALGDGPDACLLIHGFAGSPAHMLPLGKALAEQGFHVQGILLPGHGTTVQDMSGANWRAWLDCAREAAYRLRQSHGRVLAAGLSMGGLLSLLLAQEGLVDAVVTISAPLRVYHSASTSAALLLRRFSPNAPSAQREWPDYLREYDHGYPGMPARRVGDLLRIMRRAERCLSQVTCPLLVVQSLADGVVRPVSADILFAKAASEKKELLLLEKSPHVATLGQERGLLTRRVVGFFQRYGP